MIDLSWLLDENTQSALWMISVGALVNTACAVLGCYLVLQRMSLLGDALAHAVLPGLVVAFLLAGSLSLPYMVTGAVIVGLLTAFLTQTLHRFGGVAADAAMGVVFTSLFALGVILIRRYAHDVDLDPDCVLYGQLLFVEFYTVDVAGYAIPRALVSILPLLVVNLLFIGGLWKELKLSSFDPVLATTMGYNATLLHYLLMALVAATAVASFEAVGSILVIAMLIVPGATAHLLTDRLHWMIVIASGIAIAAAVVGCTAAIALDTNVAAMMAVAIGMFYIVAVFLSPRYGVLSKLLRTTQHSLRIIREDVLAMLYRLEELSVVRLLGARQAARAVGGGMLATWGIWSLARSGSIEATAEGIRLTETGRSHAARLVRSHRLWEAYLVEYLGLPLDHVHDPAERMEHYIGESLERHIEADLPHPSTDPHGRDIPGGSRKEEG